MEPLEQFLDRWDFLSEWRDEAVLLQQAAFVRGQPITTVDLLAALHALQNRGLVRQSNQGLWRHAEPDIEPETGYYEPIRQVLHDPDRSCLAALGATDANSTVIAITATNTQLEGRFARPDLTLAFVRRWTFDPQATLEVVSFEVKRRATANVTSAYEALGHSRFVNHSYLVCPSWRREPARNLELRDICQRLGVGLIQFAVIQSAPSQLSLGQLHMVCPARRQATDPAVVETFLETALDAGEKRSLSEWARGVR